MPALLEGAGARSTTEGGFYCLKIKIVPLLFGLRGIFFVLCICQQGGGSGVLCLGGKGGGGRKTGFIQHIQRQEGADAVKVLRL